MTTVTTPKSLLVRGVVLLAVLLLTTATASAKEDDFKMLVQHVESHYHAKRLRIPLLGLANFAVKIVRPKGVKGFKLAVFEDQDFSPQPGDRRFETTIRGVLPLEWQPLVCVRSRGGERTYIYAREDGKDIKLLVVTLGPRNAVVIEAKLNPKSLMNDLDQPRQMGKSWGE